MGQPREYGRPGCRTPFPPENPQILTEHFGFTETTPAVPLLDCCSSPTFQLLQKELTYKISLLFPRKVQKRYTIYNIVSSTPSKGATTKGRDINEPQVDDCLDLSRTTDPSVLPLFLSVINDQPYPPSFQMNRKKLESYATHKSQRAVLFLSCS